MRGLHYPQVPFLSFRQRWLMFTYGVTPLLFLPSFSLLHWETFLLFPLAACSHPETGRPGFSSWTRDTSRGVSAPGAHEEKFQNMPLTRHICMQARTEVFRKSGFGFQAPSFQWGITCQQCGPSLSQCPLLCRDLVIYLSCLLTPMIPGNDGFEEALKREERASPTHRSQHETAAQTGRDR